MKKFRECIEAIGWGIVILVSIIAFCISSIIFGIIIIVIMIIGIGVCIYEDHHERG